jgi:hypothetical protein
MKAVCVLGEGKRVWVLGGSYDFAVYAWSFGLDGDPPDARAGLPVLFADHAISAMLALDSHTAVVASWDGTLRLLSVAESGITVGPVVRTDDLVTYGSSHSPLEARRRVS